MERIDGDEQLLPGLGEPDRPTGDLENAARRTIAALQAADLLDETHTVLVQSLLTLARQYDRAVSSSRAKEYAVANLHAQLLATIEHLPQREEDTEDDPWTQLEREIHEQQRDAAARHTS